MSAYKVVLATEGRDRDERRVPPNLVKLLFESQAMYQITTDMHLPKGEAHRPEHESALVH